jgi:hypothetical protein
MNEGYRKEKINNHFEYIDIVNDNMTGDVIRGILAYWAVIDGIHIKQAEIYLCNHIGVQSISEIQNESFNSAFAFCFENAFRLNRKTGNLNLEQQEIIQALLSAFKHTCANEYEEIETVYKRRLGIDDFRVIGAEDMLKVASCYWSILNQFIKYIRYIRNAKH